MTEILLPLCSGAETLPCNYSWSRALDSRYVQTGLRAIRYFNEEVSVFCIEGFGICTLTGVACVRRTCELMTLFITHLIITHSLMPQTATNSLNKFLLLEIKLLCFSCDLLEECCCYCLFFNVKSSFQRKASWLHDVTPLSPSLRYRNIHVESDKWTMNKLHAWFPCFALLWSLILDCYNCFSASCAHITNVYVAIEM